MWQWSFCFEKLGEKLIIFDDNWYLSFFNDYV